MKQTFCWILPMFWFVPSWAQPCIPDDAILNGEELFLPEFWSPANPVFEFSTACINQPYAQTLTIRIPATVFIPGSGDVDVNSLSLATTGGILGLPSGMSYTCNPPDCFFESETLGCIQLEGTPDNTNNAPDTVALNMIGVLDIGFPTFITIPEALEPGTYWPLILETEEDCLNAVKDRDDRRPMIGVFPNPFQTETSIRIFTAISGHELCVYDVSGRLRQKESVELHPGSNDYIFHAKGLEAGIFFLQLRGSNISTTTRIIVTP